MPRCDPVPPPRAPAGAKPDRPTPLTGTHPGSLEGNALTLPEAVRGQLGEAATVFLTPGPDGCLWLVGADRLERLAANVEKAASANGDGRRARRLYFARTEAAAVDGAGRVVLPKRLLESACLGGEVVVIGVEDRFEVWDAGRWRDYAAGKSPSGGEGPRAASWNEP
jgi:MraZ protein